MHVARLARRDDERERALPRPATGWPSPTSRAGRSSSASSAPTITPSVPSLPTNQSTGSCTEQIAGGVLLHRWPPDFHGGPVRDDHGERADVGARGAVAQGARPGGVAGNRPAHGALLIAGRVGREEQPVRRQRALQIAEQHAGLRANRATRDVEVEHARHGARGEQDAAIGDGGARGARLRAGGRHGRAVGGGVAHHVCHLGGAGRPRHGIGHAPQPGRIACMRLAHRAVVREGGGCRVVRRRRQSGPPWPSSRRGARAAFGAPIR